jgi:hypothetical protein
MLLVCRARGFRSDTAVQGLSAEVVSETVEYGYIHTHWGLGDKREQQKEREPAVHNFCFQVPYTS